MRHRENNPNAGGRRMLNLPSLDPDSTPASSRRRRRSSRTRRDRSMSPSLPPRRNCPADRRGPEGLVGGIRPGGASALSLGIASGSSLRYPIAVRSWRDPSAAHRLRERVVAVSDDGGLIRASAALLSSAATVADEHGISVYDAAYVVAARASGGELVSCDLRDLVSRGLARLPGDAPVGRLGS
jgi:hypothetical protein